MAENNSYGKDAVRKLFRKIKGQIDVTRKVIVLSLL